METGGAVLLSLKHRRTFLSPKEDTSVEESTPLRPTKPPKREILQIAVHRAKLTRVTGNVRCVVDRQNCGIFEGGKESYEGKSRGF